MPALSMLHQFAGRKLPADLCEAITMPHGLHRRGAHHLISVECLAIYCTQVLMKIASDKRTEKDCIGSAVTHGACGLWNAMFLTIIQCVYYLRKMR